MKPVNGPVPAIISLSMRPVNSATAAPVTGTGLTLEQEESTPLQEHAARGCTPINAASDACICAGASRHLAWLAGFTYVLKGHLPADIEGMGKPVIRVAHEEDADVKTSFSGWEYYGHFSIIEYFSLKGSPPKMYTDQDCFGQAVEFNRVTRCGLRSTRTIQAQLLIQVSGFTEWDGFIVESATSRRAGESTKNMRHGHPTVSGDMAFVSPASADARGGPWSMRPAPEHCNDWAKYLYPDYTPKLPAAEKNKHYRTDTGGRNRVSQPSARSVLTVVHSQSSRAGQTSSEGIVPIIGGARIMEPERELTAREPGASAED